MNQKLEISFETILKIAFAILIFYFLYLVRDILVFVFFGSIISILFNPAIDFLEEKRLPRVLATIFVYLLFFLFFGFLIYRLAPFFISEFQQFSQFFSQSLSKILPFLKFVGLKNVKSFEDLNKAIQEWLSTSSSSIFGAISSVFGGIFSAFSILALAFFFSLEKGEIEKKILNFLPPKYRDYIISLFEEVQKKVSAWFGLRILSCIFVGILTLVSCLLLKIDYPFSLSFLAGFLELIPVLGPILAAFVLSLFVFLESPTKALFIFLIFFFIQQIEGNILTPVLAKKIVKLPSVLVLISLMIGGKIFGFLGAVLAIPLFGFLFEFFSDFFKKQYE
jgi:predicted PurR-regulated permease PerM